jgi:acyl carrier protein
MISSVEINLEMSRVVRDAIDGCSLASPDINTAGENSTPTMTSTFDNLGFDSLAFMEFCISVHVDTGVELTIEKTNELGTPQAVIDYLVTQK